jgi:transposase InsO family protein
MVRDEVVEFVQYWAPRTELKTGQLVQWLGISASKYYDWCQRQGQANQHNGQVPKDNWLEPWEQEAIRAYYQQHSEEGYRRLAYMMLDDDVVAVSPSSVYRVLSAAGLLKRWSRATSTKGQGFNQPFMPHQHWHVDIAYLNICGTFYYLCSLLDGYSRYIVHQEIREQMTEMDVEIIIQRAREKFPQARPRIISDNGPQFIARDFKSFIRQCGMTHVRTSPRFAYPQSNGKLERWHKTVKGECIRPKTPLSLSDARRIVDQFVRYYNQVRLHSAIGYVAPQDRLTGQDQFIFAERKRKLAQARQKRRENRRRARLQTAVQRQNQSLTSTTNLSIL